MSAQLFEISANTVISPAPDQISSELDGEAVILNLDSGTYYGLNEVGARIWELIQKPRSFSELHSTLLAEYEVQPDVCKQELTTILLKLMDANLIKMSNEVA